MSSHSSTTPPQLELTRTLHHKGYSEVSFKTPDGRINYNVVTGGHFEEQPEVYRNGYPMTRYYCNPDLFDHLITQARAIIRLTT